MIFHTGKRDWLPGQPKNHGFFTDGAFFLEFGRCRAKGSVLTGFFTDGALEYDKDSQSLATVGAFLISGRDAQCFRVEVPRKIVKLESRRPRTRHRSDTSPNHREPGQYIQANFASAHHTGSASPPWTDSRSPLPLACSAGCFCLVCCCCFPLALLLFSYWALHPSNSATLRGGLRGTLRGGLRGGARYPCWKGA